MLTTGCRSLGFYGQAIHGQCEIVLRQKPVETVIQSPETPPAVAEKLSLVLGMREFAEAELGLDPGKHYLRYADLGRDYVVWNVFATPEFSLEAKDWWYPVVGNLTYRGYFNEADAQRCAARLRKRGYDVCVAGVDAYSTLGWFRDPVMNTFIDREITDLATLIFHELSHLRVFKPGDTDFNEGFATAVAEEGVHRWLVATERQDLLANYHQELRRERQFIQLIQETIDELEILYARTDLSPAQLAKAKATTFDEFRSRYAKLRDEQWEGYSGYDRWMANDLNNAKLNTIATYYDLVPAFHQLLAESDGSFKRFYVEVERLTELDDTTCLAQLDALRERFHANTTLAVAAE